MTGQATDHVAQDRNTGYEPMQLPGFPLVGLMGSTSNGAYALSARKRNKTGRAASVDKASLIARHTSSEFLVGLYDPICDLGSGSFSAVRLARERRTAQERVVKDVRLANMKPEAQEFTKHEMRLLAELDHPNVVKLFEFAEDVPRQQLVLILEYIPDGDCNHLLHHARRNGRCLSEELVADLTRQLLVAVCYCHSRQIVHRDIKPENMMIARRSSDRRDGYICKLVDFGLALKGLRSRAFVGTPAYMSPELVEGVVDYTSRTDLWSAGVTVTELLAGMAPFGTPEELGSMDAVFSNIRKYDSFEDIKETLSQSPNWQGRSPESRDFVRSLMMLLPLSRPTAAEALLDEWLEARSPPLSKGLTGEMVQSMVAFAEASPLVRACLVIIAARRGVYGEHTKISEVFAASDFDCDGQLSKDELRDAATATSFCWQASNNEMRALLFAMDRNEQSTLSFMEFVAACSYTHFESEEAIATEAFDALDHDRNSKVLLRDILNLFDRPALPLLQRLPKDRPFTCFEWCECVMSSTRNNLSRHLNSGRQKSGISDAGTDPGMSDSVFTFLSTLLRCGCYHQSPPYPEGESSLGTPMGGLVRPYDVCADAEADEDCMFQAGDEPFVSKGLGGRVQLVHMSDVREV